jgi:transcriptional regulator with GAF, ATPase, and Fis domain
MAADPSTTLLRACSAQFLFRALATTDDEVERSAIRAQILRIAADLTGGAERGFVIAARDETGLRRSAALERVPGANVSALLERVLAEGLVADSASELVAAPLYVHGAIEGVLAIEGGEEHRDLMSALATLASAALEGGREVAGLAAHNEVLKAEIEERPTGIVGGSPAIARLLERIARVAPQETTVLILGESGTGKELAARALHTQSPRAKGPFVAINCAALTESLLESELFGHEKGAFTGAAAQKKGKLELAEGGTAFLDEIGEMAPVLQAKLLRVLQQREFERVGGTRTLRLDVRLIAATNRDLAAEAARGAFRSDLYHRLNVVALNMPPLRERTEDIVLLARYFLRLAAARCGRRVDGFSPEAERVLAAYAWPGNVRELENAIERAVVLGDGALVLPEDLPETIFEASAAEPAGAFQSALGDTKRDLIRKAWAECGGDYKLAAGQLGMHPNSLLRLIRRLGLRESLAAG